MATPKCLVFVRKIPLKWMMTGGTSILGNPQIFKTEKGQEINVAKQIKSGTTPSSVKVLPLSKSLICEVSHPTFQNSRSHCWSCLPKIRDCASSAVPLLRVSNTTNTCSNTMNSQGVRRGPPKAASEPAK